jgi:MoaA/NifB/PqqE/SkfB family radical SAM enzyme
MSAHFRGGTPVLHAYRECRVGLRTLDIGADGTAKHCFLHPIGNLRTQSLRELWENPTRRKVIEKTLACEHARGKCGVSCTSYRTGAQELRRGLLFLKMGRQREMREVKCA